MNTTAPSVIQAFKSFNELPLSPQANRVSLNSTEIQTKSLVENLEKSPVTAEKQRFSGNILEFSSIAPLLSFSASNLVEKSFQIANTNVQMENPVLNAQLENSIFSRQIGPPGSQNVSINSNFSIFEESETQLKNSEGSPGGQEGIHVQKTAASSVENPQGNVLSTSKIFEVFSTQVNPKGSKTLAVGRGDVQVPDPVL